MEPYRQAVWQTIQSSTLGSTHIRTHVDVDTDHGLWGIEGVMQMRDAFRDIMDVEIAAFPQSGLLRRPGTMALMEEAMKLGAEIVGGIDPCAIDRDPKGHHDAVYALCQRFGKPLDIHLHEPGEMGAFSLDLICERTRALGMAGKVVISHAFCLGADRESAGVRVCAGSDGIRDTWSPYGNGDMLERAMFVGLRNNFRRHDEVRLALDTCTVEGAKVLELKGYGVTEGCQADLVILPGETVEELVAARPPQRRVIKRGKIVARDGVSIHTPPA
jgi:cytosine/adenosine deaminase-related metal-dependent hydrolase